MPAKNPEAENNTINYFNEIAIARSAGKAGLGCFLRPLRRLPRTLPFRKARIKPPRFDLCHRAQGGSAYRSLIK